MEKTKGPNVRYEKKEGEQIKQEIYDFLKSFDSVGKASKMTYKVNSLQKKNKVVDEGERKINTLILSDPRLYQGIQKIYRNHGVDIPSQRTVDKGEVIVVKKTIVKENLETIR